MLKNFKKNKMRQLNLAILIASWLLLTLGCGEGQKGAADSSRSAKPSSDSTVQGGVTSNRSEEKSSTATITPCVEETDKVTGKTHFSFTEPITTSEDGGKTGLLFYGLLDQTRQSLVWIIQGLESGFSCVDDDDDMYILFRDGTRLQLKNDGKFNCDGKFTEYFGGVLGKKKQLEEISTKEIETIRLTSSHGSVERTLDPEQSKLLLQSILCLKAGMK
jgi:hypothetical protein